MLLTRSKTYRWLGVAVVLCVTILFISLPTLRRLVCHHVWEDPTCTAPKLCLKCGATSGDALGHDWNAATCIDPVLCKRCGVMMGEPLGHEIGTWETTVEPTCAESGEESAICVRCGEIVEVRSIPAVEHSFGEWETVREPTCTELGSRERICTECGFVEDELVNCLPHTFIDDEWIVVTGSMAGKICSVCGNIVAQRMLVASDLYTFSEIVEQAEARKGEEFKICGRVVGVRDGSPIRKETLENPKGGKLDTVVAYVQWGEWMTDDGNYHTGEVAHIEIDGSRYYAPKGWSFQGDQIQARKVFTALCTLKGLDEDGHPVFTCTKWTCEYD